MGSDQPPIMCRRDRIGRGGVPVIRQPLGSPQAKFRRWRGGSGNMPVMFRLMVGVATVATLIGVAGSAHAQVTPGPRRAPPPAAPTAPSDPADAMDRHLSLGLELGPGGVLTSYDVSASPSALLFYTALRASYDLKPAWSGGVTLRQWWLPDSNHATMYGLTARYEPIVSSYGRVFGDVAIGMTSTSTAWAFGFDLGAGIEWDLPDLAGLSLGPYLRYGQVLNPDSQTSADGRAWSVGIVHVPLRPRGGERAARRRPAPQRGRRLPPLGPRFRSRRRRRRPGPVPHVAQGKHPDPFKPGCPENDEDGDEVPDVDDACPVSVPGANPDPKRPGCPLVDTDKDGIADPDDQCPLKPGPADARSRALRLPEPRRRGPPEEGAPPPGERPRRRARSARIADEVTRRTLSPNPLRRRRTQAAQTGRAISGCAAAVEWPAMADPKRRRQLKTFPGWTPDRFQHPQDQAATEALAGIPGLDMVVSKVMEYGFERLYYLENIADNVRVTPRMLPRLHRYLGWGCRILDVEEPELYVTMDPMPERVHLRPQAARSSCSPRGSSTCSTTRRLLRHRPRAGPHQGRPRALHGAGAQHRRIIVGARPGDAGHRLAARAGPGVRAARLVPQGRAHRRPRRPAVRAEHRPLPDACS